MPLHFYFIILGQLIIFLGFYLKYKKDDVSLVRLLTLSALFGLVFGISFDITFGLLGSYTYIVESQGIARTPWRLSSVGLVLNGVLSFGLGVATAYFIVPKSFQRVGRINKKILLASSACLIAVASLTVLVVDAGIVSLFACGVVVLTFGEALMIYRGASGPLLSFLIHKDIRSFVRLWLQVMIVGFLYEIINMFFPFWVWLPGLDYSHILIEGLIVVFGYMVMMHPMIIFWQIMKSNRYI